MNNKMKSAFLLSALAVLITVGCKGKSEEKADRNVDYDASRFVLASEPEGGLDVAAARQSVQDGEETVVIGRIGGSTRPWVEDRAAFDIVDPALLACSDEKEEGQSCSCKTPWDYCCESDKLPNNMVSVRFVEEDGSVVKHDARALFDIKELQTVVIRGTAKRIEGNLTILANGIFVRE